MKYLKPLLAAAPVLALSAVAAFAQDAATTATQAVAAAAPAAAAAAPTPDKGDTTWMMISTILVIMMTVPGLALFYGGLVRSKNVLSILMQVLCGFALIQVLWVIYGYSLAFAGPSEATWLSPFFGDFSKAFLHGVNISTLSETFTAGVYIPELTFVIFQLTFAAITPALIIGATAERMKFSAVLLFLVLWFTFSYLPMAHMVWWFGGPSAPNAPSGYLFAKGAYDFAGGTVVHINAGIAGLVAAIMVGPRVGLGKDNMAPHNVVMTYIGATLLWVGWFGFNAGSNLESTGLAAEAILNTTVATAAAALAWSLGEKIVRGHASALGGASGAVAGLVAITPAAGFAGPMGSIALGAIAGFVCLFAVIKLKAIFKYDDSLDVFGVHGVGGIVGAILTGVFASDSLGGYPLAGYTMGHQVWVQIQAVLTCIIWSGVVSFVSLLIVKALVGLRVTEAREREGLDIAEHGERAYN
ncbi:ammonium transporter [Oryzibacter oryziterrae]|uniref:ammonium transporter n=1 Tax=Oryzibacter oryziterrae TaxID=2766474 RepID=UPI00272AF70F|nr:ammonium transporter [Oryzibacter oryziterrae]